MRQRAAAPIAADPYCRVHAHTTWALLHRGGRGPRPLDGGRTIRSRDERSPERPVGVRGWTRPDRAPRDTDPRRHPRNRGLAGVPAPGHQVDHVARAPHRRQRATTHYEVAAGPFLRWLRSGRTKRTEAPRNPEDNERPLPLSTRPTTTRADHDRQRERPQARSVIASRTALAFHARATPTRRRATAARPRRGSASA